MHSPVYFHKCAHSQRSTVEIQMQSTVKAPKNQRSKQSKTAG